MHLKYANALLRESTPLTYWPTSAKQNLVTSQLPLILDLRTRGLGSIIRDNQRVSQYPKMFRHPGRRHKGHGSIVPTDKYTSLPEIYHKVLNSILWYRNITRCHSSHTQYHKAWHLGVTWASIGCHKESRGFAECHKMICTCFPATRTTGQLPKNRLKVVTRRYILFTKAVICFVT